MSQLSFNLLLNWWSSSFRQDQFSPILMVQIRFSQIQQAPAWSRLQNGRKISDSANFFYCKCCLLITYAAYNQMHFPLLSSGILATFIKLFLVSVFHHVSDTYNRPMRLGLKYTRRSLILGKFRMLLVINRISFY